MRIGAIIKNNWAGENNPTKYFVYTGIKGRYANGITEIDGKLENISFYKSDFKNREKFEEIGFCDFRNLIKNDLQNAKEVLGYEGD